MTLLKPRLISFLPLVNTAPISISASCQTLFDEEFISLILELNLMWLMAMKNLCDLNICVSSTTLKYVGSVNI